MKLCKDCKHYSKPAGGDPRFGLCARQPQEDDEIHPVDGGLQFTTCEAQRIGKKDCGIAGKYWEPK
jgi:hypothetical protein